MSENSNISSSSIFDDALKEMDCSDNNRLGDSHSGSLSSNATSMSDLLPAPFDEEDVANDVYMFESDHVALKGNQDYQNLLTDLVMFEAKRIQALQDMSKLIEIQEKALADPIDFVNKLQNGIDLGIPGQVDIPQPLLIEWEKYTSVPEQLIGYRRQSVRKLISDTKMEFSETSSNPDSGNGDEDSLHSTPVIVRGRVKDESKPETFNQLWTVDEQKRLEDLLIKFPPEDVEFRRYKKIADALGNRTVIQVASRVQKYFIKLARAGLPIPGRMPKMEARYRNRPLTSTHQNRDKYYMHPSTFMQAHQPPVYMSDDDESPAPSVRTNPKQQHCDISDEEDVPAELRMTDEYRELMKLKRLRYQRHSERRQGDVDNAVHTGFKCDRCEMNPIRGTRWNCQDCPADVSVDLCSLCADSQFETATHDLTHRMNPIYKPPSQTYIDRDYLRFAPSGYNYLDPNYMPVT